MKNSAAVVAVGLMATLLSPVASQWAPLAVGDRVCVEGYLMDYECIRLGTLLDNPTVATLSAQGPLIHSVSCLIDNPECVASPFEILLPINTSSSSSSMMDDEVAFIRGWRLDDDTKARAVAVAKAWGICDECNATTGTIEVGLHVGITGEIVNLGDAAGVPPTIRAVDAWTEVKVSDPATWTSLVCPLSDGGSDRPPTPPPEPTVGDVFCVEGYVMDLFCINRGTLFDNPNITTLSLEGPPSHSVHCLIDVPECLATAFEILIPPLPTAPDLYQRGWRLDDASKELVVGVAKAAGICEDCAAWGGTIERGLYVSLTATMQDVGSADSPPTIMATNITVGNATLPKCGFVTRPPPLPPTVAPTAAPAAAPTAAAPAPAPAAGVMTLEEGLTLQTVDNGNNTATFTLVYAGEAWVALGVSPSGAMIGSYAVIGLPSDTGGDVTIYNLNSKEKSGVLAAPDNDQILTSSSVTQVDGITTVTFTVPLESETPFSVLSSGVNRYIYAYGSSNELDYHAKRGEFNASLAGGPNIGDEFCVEGYLMDVFCIEQGTLVDNPDIETLSPEGPPIHSIHCMIDIRDCLASPFEIVVKPQDGETMFQRGWRLDDDAKEMAVALAKQVGKCDVCSGTQTNNFYLAMTAILQDLGTADRPPLISVKDMEIVAGDPVQTCPVITPPPPAPAPVDREAPGPAPGGVLTLEPGFTLGIEDNGDNTATFSLVYEGEGWVALGVSPSGDMVGSHAVIGLPGGEDPVIYFLGSKVTEGVVPADSDQQILTSSSVAQVDGITTLTFTVPLESEAPFSISASGETGYIYAYGSSNELGYHAKRGDFSSSLQIAGGGDDQVCIEGYLMDLFCINRGTLFDNQSVGTLTPEGPPVHSVHCLIDVPECVGSPFEILLPSTTGDGFIQGWRLDDSTKAQAIALAKASGICDDCDEGGTIERGLYVTLKATISDPSTRPPTVSAVGDVSVADPKSLTCPGGSAYPPEDDETPAVPSGIIELEEGFTLESKDNGDNTATFTLVYEGEGWVALGVSPSSAMVGSLAVIGLPDGGDPLIFTLGSKENSGVVAAGSDQQILTSSSVTQENGVTTLTFTVPLEAGGPFSISATGDTGYIYAYGSSNVLDYHAKRGAFSASLQGGATRVDASGKYKAHGWIMSIAWGIFVPLAIGASLLRDLLPGPPGTFFMIHRALNTTAIVLVIIGFALAVAAVESEGLPHFSQSKHRTTGVVIFAFALAQGLNGYLRPHLPHAPDPDADAGKDAAAENAEEGENLMTDKPPEKPAEEKSDARKFWEVGHRLLGFGLLATSWWNCVTGIQAFNLKFSNIADPSLTSIFLGVTLGLAGVIFVVYAGRKVMNQPQ